MTLEAHSGGMGLISAECVKLQVPEVLVSRLSLHPEIMGPFCAKGMQGCNGTLKSPVPAVPSVNQGGASA